MIFLVDVIDHWFRICSQRKGALEDDKFIQLSLEIVLNNAHRILNKRKLHFIEFEHYVI